MRTSGEKVKVFISYSRKDSERIARIAASLSARGDIAVFKDTEDILPTEEWRKRLEGLIADADTVVFCLSPSSAASEVCKWEVEYASRLNKRIAPIVIHEVVGPVPEGLSKFNYIHITERDDFDLAISKLADSLNIDIAWIREHTRLGTFALRWQSAGHPRDQLLRGREIDEAERWIKYQPSTAPDVPDITFAYVQESRRRQISERRRARLGLFALIVIAGLAATAWYLEQYWRPIADVAFHRAMNLPVDFTQPATRFRECSFCPEMVIVPAGTFTMGSPDGEIGRKADEGPRHRTTISNAFAVSRFEITFDEWDACADAGGCRNRPSNEGWGSGRRPVTNVSWHDAKEYVTWLASLTGHKYRLLSEAEWEYAARAGTSTPYSWGDDVGNANANCAQCGSQWDNKQTAPVGSFKPNQFGLYDMHGNVNEWVEDCQTPYPNEQSAASVMVDGECEYRVKRSGSWITHSLVLRAAQRGATRPNVAYNTDGLRIARELRARNS